MIRQYFVDGWAVRMLVLKLENLCDYADCRTVVVQISFWSGFNQSSTLLAQALRAPLES